MVDVSLLKMFAAEGCSYSLEVKDVFFNLIDEYKNGSNCDEGIIDTSGRFCASIEKSACFLELPSIEKVACKLKDILNECKKLTPPANNTVLDAMGEAYNWIYNEIERLAEGEVLSDDTIANNLIDKLSDTSISKTEVEEEDINLDGLFDEPTDEIPQPTEQATEEDAWGETQELEQATEEDPWGETFEQPEQQKEDPWGETFEEVQNASEDVLSESEKVAEPALEGLSQEITDEIKIKFIQESDELLEQVEEALLLLEDSDDIKSQIDNAFRMIHSLKGNCGFLNLKDLEQLSHKMENALEQMQEGVLAHDANNIAIMLKANDILCDAIADVSKGNNGAINDIDSICKMIDEMKTVEEVSSQDIEETKNEEENLPLEKEAENKQADKKETTPKEVMPAKRKSIVRRDIRVDLEKLDGLINLVGEMVIAEAMVTRCPVVLNLEDESYDRAVHNLRRITSDLQDMAMSVRMVPLSASFRKMIRLVHDVSKKIGKEINLTLIGEETEVDKTVIESIGDPLVHIIRNSIDHGVEASEDREALGKNRVGEISIEGRHEGGEVWIIIHDDGKGLNREKLLEKAIARNMIEGDGSDLTDSDVFKLIFEAGFSTAAEVTDVSGRGVGMDVVRTNIEKLKGRVDIKSAIGKGTTITLRIPLTLAIIEGMLVRVGKTRYTIPLLSIRESVRIKPEQITTTPDGQEVARIRDEMISIMRLHKIFDKTPDCHNLEDGILVILDDGANVMALFLDEILGQQQTVIKGLSTFLGESRAVSGCTILGDGQVSLILDVGQLMKRN